MDQNGKLTRGSGDVVFGGVQILKTDHIHQIKEASFSLNIVWDQMLSSNRLYGVTYPGKWCDVGHPEGIVLAENMLRSDNV